MDKFLTTLEILLKSGVPLQQALEHMSRKGTDRKVSKLAKACLGSIRRGKLMADTPELQKALGQAGYVLLRAGEQSGKLVEAIQRVEKLRRTTSRVKKTLIGNLLYPLFVILMASVLAVFMNKNVMPQVVQIIGERQLNTLTILPLYMKLANPVSIISFLGFIFLLTFLSFLVATRYHGKFRKMLDSYPPFSIYRWWMGVVFLYILQSLLKSGVYLSQSLQLIMQTNPYYKTLLKQVYQDIEKGGLNLGEAMSRRNVYLPDKEVVGLLSLISELPDFYDKLSDVANSLLERAEEKVKGIGKILNIVALMFAGLIVIGYILSFQELMGVMSRMISGGIR